MECGSQGPLCLMYRRSDAGSIAVTALEDPYGRRRGRFEPYDVTLVADGLYLITVVAPDKESEFSRSVIEAMVDATGDRGRSRARAGERIFVRPGLGGFSRRI